MYFSEFNIDAVSKYVSSLSLSKNDCLLFMVAENTVFDYDALQSNLNALDVNFIGGIFPEILYDKQRLNSGFIIKTIHLSVSPLLIQDLENYSFQELNTNSILDDSKSALIFIDGLTANIANFLSNIFNELGDTISYIGGGCGSLSLEQKPAVFNNEGFFQDAAVVVFLKKEMSLGVKHGWQEIKGPFVASSSNKNVVKELNWQNAFEIYKSVVEEDSGRSIGIDNFFDVAKSYPLGIIKENEEQLVRDPIATNEAKELLCVGEVPENAVLSILKGEKDSLIDAAHLATQEAVSKVTGTIDDVLIIDCISRVLFLEDNFHLEIEAIDTYLYTQTDIANPVEGVLTLGEIASSEGYIEFHNKTIVVGLFLEEKSL